MANTSGSRRGCILMSHQLISRSPHLLRLRNEGYNLDTYEGYLMVHDVPYVNAQRKVCRSGVLVMALNLVADVAGQPSDHTAHFIGDCPCDSQGRPLGFGFLILGLRLAPIALFA